MLSAHLLPRRQLRITRSSAGCTSSLALAPSALTSFWYATSRSGSTNCGSNANAVPKARTPSGAHHDAVPSVVAATKSPRTGRFIRPGAFCEAP